ASSRCTRRRASSKGHARATAAAAISLASTGLFMALLLREAGQAGADRGRDPRRRRIAAQGWARTYSATRRASIERAALAPALASLRARLAPMRARRLARGTRLDLTGDLTRNLDNRP